jgi:hypothetical protein
MTRPYQWQDTAWKEVMGAFFEEFVALCLPSLYVLVDWTRPWISLDKELHTITNDSAIGKRYVDKCSGNLVMSALSNLEMSSFGLKLDRLSGTSNLEENPNDQRTTNDEPTRNRASEHYRAGIEETHKAK